MSPNKESTPTRALAFEYVVGAYWRRLQRDLLAHAKKMDVPLDELVVQGDMHLKREVLQWLEDNYISQDSAPGNEEDLAKCRFVYSF
jgi:hypothetical protein